MKKIIFIVISFLLFSNNVFALDLNSKNAVVYNLNEDKLIFDKNSEEIISIASLTKIMTTIVAIEHIDNLDSKITIQNRDFVNLYEEGASLAGFKVNQEVTYRDLLYGTFLPSGAEATQALAFNLTGSIENFVNLMNQKAGQLELTNTHFANTTGLDDKNNYSTVIDIAKLLKYCLNNQTFKEIYQSNSYKISDDSMTLYSSFRYTASKYNYNTDYIIGGKTGYTDDAGKCLASTAFDENNNISYMSVTCGASTNTDDAYHIKDNVNIYNYFFQNYKYQTLINEDDLLVSIKAKYDKNDYIKFYADKPIFYYLNNDYDLNKVKIVYNGIDEINIKTKRGKIGYVDIYYDNEPVTTIDIFLSDEYHFSIFKFITQNKISSLIIISILLLCTIIIIHKKKS